MLIDSYVNKFIIHPAICAAVSSRTVGHHCSLARPYHSAMALRGRKVFGIEIDPGDIKGTKLKVLKYPHPKLRAENSRIDAFDEDLKTTAQEMLLVMYAADGIGLAAPQVGINKRLMVFNERGESTESESEMVLANPEIVATSLERLIGEEGCLSFPQVYGKVERHAWIEVRYQSISGEVVQTKFTGKPAIIFQHEYDHLDKVLFIDRLLPEDKVANLKRLEKSIKKYGPGGAI